VPPRHQPLAAPGRPQQHRDLSRYIDSAHKAIVDDSDKIFSGPRSRRARQSAVEERAHRTFRTHLRGSGRFCAEFMQHVLPRYPDFATTNAELVVAWTWAIDHIDIVSSPLLKHVFRDAVPAVVVMAPDGDAVPAPRRGPLRPRRSPPPTRRPCSAPGPRAKAAPDGGKAEEAMI
jgi:hypothetical protein